MAQHQELRFCIHSGALPPRSDPGRSDLDALVDPVDIHEPCAADRLTRTAFDRGEHYRLTTPLFRECLIDKLLEIVPCLHFVRNPAKGVFEVVLRHVPEKLRMLTAN